MKLQIVGALGGNMLDYDYSATIGTKIAEIQGLRVEFQTKDGPVIGVSNVSFDIKSGETVCVVGESGSGKSVSSLSLMRLVEFGGGEITNGRLLFNRKDLEEIDLAQAEPNLMRSIRGNEIGMIFQEPMTALNPVFTVERQLTEGLRLHKGLSKAAASAKALDLMREVRIPEPERRLKQYPHELSGGQRQRVVIARALALEPKILICDESVAALDISVQAQVLNLLNDLQEKFNLSYLFISHDLSVVQFISDKIMVMDHGMLVENKEADELYRNPEQDATKNLIAAIPKISF